MVEGTHKARKPGVMGVEEVAQALEKMAKELRSAECVEIDEFTREYHVDVHRVEMRNFVENTPGDLHVRLALRYTVKKRKL